MKHYMRLKGKLAALLALVLILGEVNVPVTAWAAIDATDQALVLEADTELTGSLVNTIMTGVKKTPKRCISTQT